MQAATRRFGPLMLFTLIVLFPTLVLASPARNFGLQAGIGFEPDQFVVGAQGRAGEIVPNVYLAPSIELGFGDDISVYSGSFDAVVNLSPPNSRSAFYVGGGPTLSYLNPKVGDGDTELGVGLLAGVKLPFGNSNNWNIEARYGIGDIPEIRVLAGVLFGSQPVQDE